MCNLKGKLLELCRNLVDIDVAVLIEIWLYPDDDFYVSGFEVVRSDRKNLIKEEE